MGPGPRPHVGHLTIRRVWIESIPQQIITDEIEPFNKSDPHALWAAVATIAVSNLVFHQRNAESSAGMNGGRFAEGGNSGRDSIHGTRERISSQEL